MNRFVVVIYKKLPNKQTEEEIKIMTQRDLLRLINRNRNTEDANTLKFVVYELGEEVLDWS